MKIKKIILLVALGVQILFFGGWILQNEINISENRTTKILLRAVPADPRNLISGNYFILSYDFSTMKTWKRELSKYDWNWDMVDFDENKKTIYLVMKSDGDYYVPKYFTSKKPVNLEADEVFLKGRNAWRSDFGIGRFYINENTIEPKVEDKIEVLVAVSKDGTARILQVYVNDEVIK